MSEIKVNGPEDAEVSEMIKQLLLEKIRTILRCFQRTLHGSDGGSEFVEDCETGALAEGIQSHSAIALTEVMSKWYGKELENWKKMHGGVEGMSCQHLQVMMTHLHLNPERQEKWVPMLRHGSAVRPTMCLASTVIKSAVDEARPRHVARIMETHNTHGWVVAFVREMAGLEGQAMFKVENFFQSMFPPRKRQPDCGKRWHAILGKCGGGDMEKNGFFVN